ncbi:HD domain-containing protein [Carboxylicivirga sp. N1Y90]|uniref:HD domain-containing protein n=1 Tax=Carboxylicivirga fragile TaxID=3417571 RepID=UPI003D34C1CD|nr:HDIG domain-containing protein [Marinilabiliaceae bacterium N1Y90]
MVPTRQQALALFKQYNQSESLYKHALSVEAVMRHFANKYNEDEEKWGIIGLMHDVDYEQFPEEHCIKAKEILEKEQWPEDYIRAILSHAYDICTDVEPVHLMEKILYATDELTGLVTTAALVRPDKSIHSLKLKSMKKRWKDKRFAAKVDRSIITDGAQRLNMDLDELILETIEGMKTVAKELGLNGVSNE